jgi:hypothetical protein
MVMDKMHARAKVIEILYRVSKKNATEIQQAVVHHKLN